MEQVEKWGELSKANADYLCDIIGNNLLGGGKGQLLNIIEACGLSNSQEQAVKRMVVDWLYQMQGCLVSTVNNMRSDQSCQRLPLSSPIGE